MKTKYRIKKIGRYYYPQEKFLFFWRTCKTYVSSDGYMNENLKDVYFKTEEEAKKYIRIFLGK